MLKVILIRHGEEEKAKLNNTEYQTFNSNLTAKGIEQVKKLASKLKKQNITEIYSSDIKRALQTAEIVAKELNLDVKLDKRLRERDIGELEKYGDDWRKVFNKIKEKELAKGILIRDIRPPGGENLYDFRDRIKSFLNDLSKKEGNILVSAHRGVNTAVINFAQNWNTPEFKTLEQNHACINILSFDNKQWNVLAVNETCHLNENEFWGI